MTWSLSGSYSSGQTDMYIKMGKRMSYAWWQLFIQARVKQKKQSFLEEMALKVSFGSWVEVHRLSGERQQEWAEYGGIKHPGGIWEQ